VAVISNVNVLYSPQEWYPAGFHSIRKSADPTLDGLFGADTFCKSHLPFRQGDSIVTCANPFVSLQPTAAQAPAKSILKANLKSDGQGLHGGRE
jgi:hypothetical protein